MKAVTYQGKRNVSVDEVADPRLIEPTDAIIRVSSAAICGSDLHLYELFGPFLDAGDILGHEAMGEVVEVGSAIRRLRIGDRVVIPFPISCGECFMCLRGLHTQCETTQVREHGTGARLYGYTKLYGQVPGGQAEYLRVQLADVNAIVVRNDLPDVRYLFLSDILPTAWQAVEYARIPDAGTVAVLGLGPIGQLASRIARHRGYRVVGVDPVPERRTMAQRHGVETLALTDEISDELKELTDGRGPDSVIDAVGMEAHGSPAIGFAQQLISILPDAVAAPALDKAGMDRTAALYASFDAVRRGGTVSLSGVYAGDADIVPMKTLFDKQVTIEMGQCNVQRWVDQLLPYVEDQSDPFGVTDLVTHEVPLADAPALYETFQKKEDGCVKVVLKP